MNIALRLSTCLLLATAWSITAPAQAETFNTCAGFIESLPATITSQGVWCLDKDLSTGMASGAAITIATNNVTIDCNDFKIGGLAAGDESLAAGILAVGRQNATVRHCATRGFYVGIYLAGGAGHSVEDNRLDQNLFTGIWVSEADNSQVRGNRVFDTGGSPGRGDAFGIRSSGGNVIDNEVSGVFALGAETTVYGIFTDGPGLGDVRGNLIRGLAPTSPGRAFGLRGSANGSRFTGNHISAAAPSDGAGIYGSGQDTFCSDNSVINFSQAYQSCEHNSNNLPAPAP